MDNHVAVRMLLILAATVILFAIVAVYSRNKDKRMRAGFSQQEQKTQQKRLERFDDYAAADGSDSLRPPRSMNHATPPTASPSNFGITDLVAPYPSSVVPADSIAVDQMKMQRRSYDADARSASRASTAAERSSSCYPKDELNPEDLIPKDSADSRWARMNPSGQGDIQDQNFLTAGYNMGIDTQGSSLRNANQQLRSEPPNSQFKVSPWNMTTIAPDTNRRPLEIGGDY